ncbi:hypothetical protein BGY98DRAFT_615140 [Russula aff. rugulosa BPL654]|nr:hypothetical protein BGY98DRAFT_615140 [Russula aff. rugulosa BPL654]
MPCHCSLKSCQLYCNVMASSSRNEFTMDQTDTNRQNSDTWPIITPYTYSHTYTLPPATTLRKLPTTVYHLPLPYLTLLPLSRRLLSNTVAVASIDPLWTQASLHSNFQRFDPRPRQVPVPSNSSPSTITRITKPTNPSSSTVIEATYCSASLLTTKPGTHFSQKEKTKIDIGHKRTFTRALKLRSFRGQTWF